MTAAALSWAQDGRVRATLLEPARPGLIGRETGAAVALTDPTVSRRQAALNERGGRYVIENLSGTNPTRVNDAPLDGETELSDGDRIKAGSVLLFFHDLSSHDTLQGPVCSYCHRENKATDKDCWYCGTSLVNALTRARERRPVVCRVISSTGMWRDLYADQRVALNARGPLAAAPVAPVAPAAPVASAADTAPSSPAVAVRSGEVRLEVPAESGDVRVNGELPESDQRLQTGDDIQVGEQRFTVVVRR
jgi:hypothetical protein